MIRIAFAHRAARWTGAVALLAVCLGFVLATPLAAAVPTVVDTATVTADNALIANNGVIVVTVVLQPIVTIPTLSRWGLAACAVLLSTGALVMSRRRAQRQN